MTAVHTHNSPALLLISPGIIKWTDLDFGLPHLVSIGGYVRQQTGVRVEILDLAYENGDVADLERTLEQLGPFAVIGVSCYSSFDYLRSLSLGRFLKSRYPNVPLVTGGYHASAMPDDVIFEGSPFDAVVRGEAERPMAEIVERALAGQAPEKREYGPVVVEDINELPMYQWDLLRRYWPRANELGRKFQIYFSRGCPYRCSFCMERSKSGYSWRAMAPERALAELEQLAQFTDLGRWIINVADPLFGFRRQWRHEFLEGLAASKLRPRQFWTLTRSDDLEDHDVKLLAKCSFSIGIGLESGSPRMLEIMNKGNQPEKYLAAILRLARLSHDHGLNWATNIIVGHPGETRESMVETRDFMRELFTVAPATRGWLSIDPFRLYPGAHVHEFISDYEAKHGSRFYHPTWWQSWYDGPFRAEHLDPSGELTFEERVAFMHAEYPAIVQTIHDRFRGKGSDVDRVYRASIAEQKELLGTDNRDRLLAYGEFVKEQLAPSSTSTLPIVGQRQRAKAEIMTAPIGLQVRDPNVRARENEIRLLLDHGVLRTARLVDALVAVDPKPYFNDHELESFLHSRIADATLAEGERRPHLRAIVLALEAMAPNLGDQTLVFDSHGYVAALLAKLVGREGSVRWLGYRQDASTTVRADLGWHDGKLPLSEIASADAVWLGIALARVPAFALRAHARLIGFVGPRHRAQDMCLFTAPEGNMRERRLGKAWAPTWRGDAGWLPAAVRRPRLPWPFGRSDSARG